MQQVAPLSFQGQDTVQGEFAMKFKQQVLVGMAIIVGLSISRPMFGAGVTVITHGFQFLGDQSIPLWAERMAVAISERSKAQGRGGAAIFEYDPDTQSFDVFSSNVPTEPGSEGEIILIFNWSQESDDPGGGFAEAAGEALFVALMRGASLPSGSRLPLGQLPLHFIGHRRGAVVISEAIRRLGALGIRVDHVTTIDPHPARGEYEDAVTGVHTWSTITFADNYWQSDVHNLR